MLNFIQKCKSVGVERRLVLYKLINYIMRPNIEGVFFFYI